MVSGKSRIGKDISAVERVQRTAFCVNGSMGTYDGLFFRVSLDIVVRVEPVTYPHFLAGVLGYPPSKRSKVFFLGIGCSVERLRTRINTDSLVVFRIDIDNSVVPELNIGFIIRMNQGRFRLSRKTFVV